MKKIILFCIPYAGGSATLYSKWNNYLDNHIDLRTIELPGRGRKYSELFYTDLGDAVEDIIKEIRSGINMNEIAFW